MHNFKKIFTKNFWKKGNGELLGFACMIPFMMFIILFIISIAQIGVINSELQQAAYNCGRAAVVSESEVIAESRAEAMYMQLIGPNTSGHSYTQCEIEVLDGADWEKGSYIRCTVRYYADVMMPFTSGVREQSVVMMIEAGDNHT